MDPNNWFRESSATGLKKLDKKFGISIDPAFKEDSDPVTINCSDIKKNPLPQLTEFKETKEKKTKEKSTNWLEVSLQDIEQTQREYIAAICAESGRTQEWAETSYEYKINHYSCEYCGETSDIEGHDILPYSRLTEGQRRNRDFLKQNIISLCHEHHHNVAHLGDPDWIKFDPRIREICELHLRSQRLEDEQKKQESHAKVQEEQENYANHTENLRSIVKEMSGNKLIVEKMIPDNKRRQ